jgi:hypothetical protein
MDSKSGVAYREGEKGGTIDRVENFETSKDGYVKRVEVSSAPSSPDEEDFGEDKRKKKPPKTARDLVTEILMVEDDPTVNPWTFRMWFIGIGMSVFAG